MKAQVQRGFGSADVVNIEDVPDAVAGPGELLIGVRACALNRLDLLQREAPLVRGFSLPHVAGMDVAGIVVGHGGGVDPSRLPIGTAVVVDPVSTCGHCRRCISGKPAYCENLRTVGSTRPGGFAELVAVPAAHASRLPDDLSFVEAAALPVAYLTGWHALIVAGQVRAGEKVLVNAAGSGVSTAVVQFAKQAGAFVVGTIGGRDRFDRAFALGCDAVVDHYAEDVSGAVIAASDGGVDLVIDHVGTALFQSSIDALDVDGRMVFCGTTTGTEATVSLPSLYHWGRRLIGAGGWGADELGDVLHAVDSGGLRPVIDSVWPFAELAAAQAHMATGGFFGKIVIEVS